LEIAPGGQKHQSAKSQAQTQNFFIVQIFFYKKVCDNRD